MVQIGSWRIDRHDRLHLSFWNANWRKTAVIYRSDSTVHVGPRSDFQRHNPSSPPQPVEVMYRPFAAWGELALAIKVNSCGATSSTLPSCRVEQDSFRL